MTRLEDEERDGDDVEYEQTEETPLMGNDLPADVIPDDKYQKTILYMSMVFLILIELGAYLQVPPTQQIMEDIICHEYYPEHALGTPSEGPCASDPKVAGKLAMIRGWQNSFDCIAPILTSIPYGVIADKYGRRPILFLSMFGLSLEFTWMMVPLIWPSIFPLWTVWFGALLQFIGGGVGVLQAMVWTMLADTIPSSQRTAAFFQLAAVGVIGELVTSPLSAFLMSKDPWIPMILGWVLLVCGTILTGFIPETLNLRRAADAEIARQLHGSNGVPEPEETEETEVDGGKRTLWQQIVFSMKNDMLHVWKFLLGSRSILGLLLSFNLGVLVKFAKVELILQYTHVRYNWKWETATLLGTVGSITNLVMYVAILPGLGWVLTKYMGKPPVVRDLWLTRLTGLVMTIGCFFIAFAFTPLILICALVLFSIGSSFTTQLRAVLNNLVEPHTIGVLNTTISVAEMICLLISAPALSALLRDGIAAGGVWIGLPFMAASAVAAVGALIPFLYRFPAHMYEPVRSD